jgi:predicted nucleotidyltransferase
VNWTRTDHGALLAALHDGGVEFLVAGGVAVWAHGYVRMTIDVDVIPDPTASNLERLARVLRDLNATAVDQEGNSLPLEWGRPEGLAVGDYFLRTDLGRLDLLNGARPDLKRYRRLAEAAIEFEIDGKSFRAISRDDLIAMKRVAGRPKDLEDIAALTEADRLGREAGLN